MSRGRKAGGNELVSLEVRVAFSFEEFVLWRFRGGEGHPCLPCEYDVHQHGPELIFSSFFYFSDIATSLMRKVVPLGRFPFQPAYPEVRGS